MVYSSDIPAMEEAFENIPQGSQARGVYPINPPFGTPAGGIAMIYSN